MKYVTAFIILLSLSFNSLAGPDGAIKPFTIGAGTYASVIAYDDAYLKDDELAGLALSFGYAVTDNIAFRGTLFSLEHDDLSSLESKGYDLLAHFGTGLATHGFKIYGGVGLFSEKWELGSVSEKFNGLQLSGGLGYNWDHVALDLIIGLRGASDYEEVVNQVTPYNVSAAAASGSLLLSFRF